MNRKVIKMAQDQNDPEKQKKPKKEEKKKGIKLVLVMGLISLMI